MSPSPYGTCADLTGIAEVCHARGKPLIVDEAWGAHLPFHEDLPTWAMDSGADICVVSVHKMGAGFEQGSVFHVQGDLIDDRRLAACADLLSTTSPSVLVDVSATGMSGYQAQQWLRRSHHIDVGLADHRRILITLSMADDPETIRPLVLALRRLPTTAGDFEPPPEVQLPTPGELQLQTVQSPRDAFFGPVETVPVEMAAGRVSAEQITPYPPGIPAIVPGELINTEVLDYLRTGLAAGMYLPDPADPELKSVRVTAPGV